MMYAQSITKLGAFVKYIYALRHAKSLQETNVHDHERPLNEVGEKAACVIGKHMKQQKWVPGYVLCSSALRTRQTYDLLVDTMAITPKTTVTDRLYLATPGEIFSSIHKQNPDSDSLLIIGHNPGIHHFSLLLSTQGDKALIDKLENGFPTAALAVIACDVDDWGLVEPEGGELTAFVTLKSLA
jgi:phosphohistidine phosphatase